MKIMSTSDVSSGPIKIVVAGEAGNGKTSLAATIQETLKEKVFIISAEAGLLSLGGHKIACLELQRKDGLPVAKTERIKYMYDILSFLNLPEQRAKYQWIFIDSLTEIQQNMLETLDSSPEFSGPKNMIKKYGELSTRMMSLCKSFRDIPHYNVVFSTLVKTENDADNIPKVKIGLMGAFAEKLPALFDEIFYLAVTKEKDKDGRNIRKILTNRTDKIDFPKDRSNKLSLIEPADLGLIVQKIRGEVVQNTSLPRVEKPQQPQLGE